MYKATLSDTQNKELLIENKKTKNSLNSQLKNTEILYYSNELDINKHDASKLWELLKKGKQGGNYLQKKTFSINVDTYVEPITVLINNSFYHGIFPDELKLARVVPIFKSGDSSNINNNRPISILPFFQKYMND